MAHLDATLICPDQHQDDPLPKFHLQPQPSSDSLRNRLNTLSDPRLIKRGKRHAQDPAKHHSPRLLHLSKKLLQIKPQIVKDQEDEVKKITRQQLFRGKQLEHARNKPTHTRAPAQSNSSSSLRRKLPILPSACLHPKRLGQQQLNLIKDQIQIIKQDINRIYPDIPSPKTDAWFRLEQLDSAATTDPVHPTRPQSFSIKIPQQSRVFVEKGVSSLNKKIQSIKRSNSQSSSLDPQPLAIDNINNPLPLASIRTGPSNYNLSPTPSLTNSSISVPTPDTNHVGHSPPLHPASPHLLNSVPTPPSSLENSQWGARYPFATKGKLLGFPGPIRENDESLDHDNATLPTQLATYNNRTRQHTSLDHLRSSSSPPVRLSIVTRDIGDADPSAPRRSLSNIPLRHDPVRLLSPAFTLTPISCLDHSIMNSQRRKSPFELLLEKGQPHQSEPIRASSSSNNLARMLLDRHSVDRERSRSSHSLPQEQMNQFKPSNPFVQHQQLQDATIPFTNSPDEIATQSRDSIRLWRTNLGRTGIDDFQFFASREVPNEVLLVTDVLIEQQGGLSFLGQENFNERFRTHPWQTMKTIHQYDRPGRPDAEYLPGVSRAEVVQTPHSPATFPLPTPEWYWVTEFSIDRQSRPVDGNGWEYYDVFSRKWSSRRHGCRTFIRRRWWVRVRAKLRGTEDVEATRSDLRCASAAPHGKPTSVAPSNFQASGSGPSREKPYNSVVCVTLMKVGVEQSITFDSSDVQGGHSHTIDLPEGLSSVQVGWDDSSLVPQNPIFSSQTCISEIFHRVLLAKAHTDLPALDDHRRQEVFEVLEKHLALINLKRVSKTFKDLSEPQKIRLWKYWLEPDESSSETCVVSKPDLKDIWKILDSHFDQVLELFRFDAYRIKFLQLVLNSYSLCSNSITTTTNMTSTPNPDSTSERNKQGVATKNRIKCIASDDVSLHSSSKRPAQHATNNTLLTPRTFYLSLDIKEIRADFWSNFLNIVPEFKHLFTDHLHLDPQLEECVMDQKDVFLKCKVSLELRTCLSRMVKSQYKNKRSNTLSK